MSKIISEMIVEKLDDDTFQVRRLNNAGVPCKDLSEVVSALVEGFKPPSTRMIFSSDGRRWNWLQREDGSEVLFYIKDGDPAQYVVWDSLDAKSN